ncbi:hypothetical protein L195_g026331, partial [Trifolium pratense]
HFSPFSSNENPDSYDEAIKHGKIEKHKVRLVAKGYAHSHGVDFSEVFAHMARWDTIRTTLSLAASKSVFQLDVKSAFLHGELLENVKHHGLDDLIYTGIDSQMMGEFESSMKEKFAMIDLGKMKDFLGVEVNQTQQGIFIHQQKYAYEILSMFGMGDCNEVCSPIVPGCKLVKDERGKVVDATGYKQMIRWYMDRPTEMHIDAVKRVLRYLKCTMSYGVLKSTSGYVFTMGTGLFLSPRRNNLLSLCQPLSQSLWPLHHVRVKECV